jgi:hypothetical protein
LLGSASNLRGPNPADLPLDVAADLYARVGGLVKNLVKRSVLDTSGAALKQAGRGIYPLRPSPCELADLTNHAITAESCLASPLGFPTSPIVPVGGPKCQEWVQPV